MASRTRPARRRDVRPRRREHDHVDGRHGRRRAAGHDPWRRAINLARRNGARRPDTVGLRWTGHSRVNQRGLLSRCPSRNAGQTESADGGRGDCNSPCAGEGRARKPVNDGALWTIRLPRSSGCSSQAPVATVEQKDSHLTARSGSDSRLVASMIANAVRYMSVDSCQEPDSAGYSGTCRYRPAQHARPSQNPRMPRSRGISPGGGRCWVRTNVG